jgi:shikimate dehydrogenase
MEIPDIFAREGEAGFRARETAAIESVAAEQGLIIATGGGAVLKEENVRLLRHNGIICLLQRDLGLLTPTGDRPLSRDRKALETLYELRLPYYHRAAELTIDNNGPAGRTVEELAQYVG